MPSSALRHESTSVEPGAGAQGPRTRQVFLAELQRKYESPGHPARQVYGVYAGWRGISVRPPWYSRASTFEDRRAAADRVGRAGDLRKLLTRINEARSEIGRSHFSPLLFAGHSLGGRALLRALTTDGQGRTDISDLQKFADLYVLLNPAISAADYLLVDRSLLGLSLADGRCQRKIESS